MNRRSLLFAFLAFLFGGKSKPQPVPLSDSNGWDGIDNWDEVEIGESGMNGGSGIWGTPDTWYCVDITFDGDKRHVKVF